MHWFQTLDTELFRLINSGLSNEFCDALMPWLSGNSLFVPALVISALLMLWRGHLRGVLCVLMLVLIVSTGDGLLCNTLKHALQRPRPFLELADVHCLVGKSGSGSMPSSHAANWFAATMVALVYYRRSVWLMLPVALLVSFSRVYNGVHYPSDVLAGALLGAGYAAAALWLLQTTWSTIGRKWFPIWWATMPSMLNPPRLTAADGEEAEPVFAPRRSKSGFGPARAEPETELTTPQVSLDQHWLRLGYLFIAVVLFARWIFIARGSLQLAEDEAYQWLWSKHLAMSYFSKPPLIAYTQFLGTTLWGDTVFGIRFFSPLVTALVSAVILRFFARAVNTRAGFFLLLIVTATPLLSVGAVLMTVDPLSVLFWTAAMLAGWRAIQEKGTTGDWLWVGLWMGLGFLSKYTELFQLLCWVVFMVLWAPARRHLRRPGPYLALLVNLLCALPVLLWNAQHSWITVHHVAVDADVGQPWRRTFVADFLGSEAALLNPVFFIATVWASVALWWRGRHNPLLIYCFSMGAPLFLAYMIHSLHARVLPNWIAPSVLPLFCVMVIYWDTRLRLGVSQVKRWLAIGLAFGFAAVIFFHATELWAKTFGLREAIVSSTRIDPKGRLGELLTEPYLPVKLDPLHRVRGWDSTAQAVEGARQVLLAEGKPVFIIADHYGLTGQLSFYLPEARKDVREHPLVYCRSTDFPENQFFFWPGYESRKGQNAIYVRELDRSDPKLQSASDKLQDEFESVICVGSTNILYHDRFLLRPLEIFFCRGVR